MNAFLPYLTTLLRVAFAAGGSWLAQRGYISDDQSGALVEQGLGLTLIAGSAVWGLWQKQRTAAHIDQAMAKHPNAEPPKVPL